MIDVILQKLAERVKRGESIPQGEWIEYAFTLNALILDLAGSLEDKRQIVALKKIEALKGQEKKNVSLAELEVSATNEYKLMKLEEAKLDQVKEFIRIAKLNAHNL